MSKQDYSSFKAADFLLDDNFVRWVRTGDNEQNLFWLRWISEHPEQKEEIDTARRILLSLQIKEPTIHEETLKEEWQKLHNAFLKEEDPQPAAANRGGLLRRSWLTAASMVLLLLSGGLLYFSRGLVANETITVRRAEAGQRLTVLLKDGTKVMLNSGSVLTYPENFRSDLRSVALKGEAFFDVAPNPRAPFLITSGKVTTEVVGTSFGITADPEKGDVQVAVVSGSVKVYASETRSGKSALSLAPAQMATFESDDATFVVSEFDKSKHLAWIDGVLYFEKDDFSTVMEKIEKWYGVKVEVDSDLEPDEELLLTGKFKNKPLNYVLDSYKYPNRFNYELHQDTLKIFE